MDINISHLRQHLPEYLARVRQGERVRVTSRGRVVAELVPPPEPAREASKDGPRRHDEPTDSGTRR